VRGSAWVRVNDAAAGSGPGWGGPALAGPRALAPRLYAALCGPMSSSPRGGLACARIGLDACECCSGRVRPGLGARRSRAPGPSRPCCMLRCVDLCPAVHVEASLVRGSAWMRVNDAAAGSGTGWGPALAGPRALAPRLYAALCGPMSSSPRGGLRLCADRLGCV